MLIFSSSALVKLAKVILLSKFDLKKVYSKFKSVLWFGFGTALISLNYTICKIVLNYFLKVVFRYSNGDDLNTTSYSLLCNFISGMAASFGTRFFESGDLNLLKLFLYTRASQCICEIIIIKILRKTR